jgi:hypothetical protein
MKSAPDGMPLPDYERPPVVEVVFAVATSASGPPITVVDLAEFGSNVLGDEFPNRLEQPPVTMPTESFDETVASLAPAFALLAGPPPLRLWFQSAAKTRLVQLQRDWIACNWQGGAASDEYPHYESIESMFFDTWGKWTDHLRRIRSEPARPLQCELTYVNHIPLPTTWAGPGKMSRVIRLIGDAADFLPPAEDGQLAVRYRIVNERNPVGRLYVQAAPGVRTGDNAPVIQLTLTARGAPIGDGNNGMKAFYRLAHEWIVRGFAAVTTQEVQDELWGRFQ